MVHAKVDTPEEFPQKNGFVSPTVLPSEAVSWDLTTFMDIMAKQREGRAGGEDGVVAESVKRLPTEAKAALYHQLYHQLDDTLRGAQPQPAHWRRANVSLIPEILQASLPGDVRPITVLPMSVKLAAKLWLSAAMPYLTLRRQSSHGFRASFQAAEVHNMMR